MPSSRGRAGAAVRPLDCSRRSPDDLLGRHPASSGRAYHARAPGGVGGHAARPRREVARGLFLLTSIESMVARASRSVGRPHPSHPQPSAPAPTYRSPAAHHPAHRRSIGRPSPNSRARGALVQRHADRPACRPAPPRAASSPRLLRPGGRGVLKGAPLRRVCAVGSPVRAGSTRPRPARARSTRLLGVGALAFGCVGSARVRALRADLSFVCPHSAPRGRDEQRHERGWFCLPVWHAALCTLAVHTVTGCGCVCV